MSRSRLLCRLIAVEGERLKQSKVAEELKIDPGEVRVWMYRMAKQGYVEKVGIGEYVVTDREGIVKLIDELKRNSVTPPTPQGRGVDEKRTPTPCRLHDIQYKANLPGDDLKSLNEKLGDWERAAPAWNSQTWTKVAPFPSMGCYGQLNIAAGKKRSTLQMFLNPIYCNSYKLFDQLEAVHLSAQSALQWISRQYLIQVALLEARRSGHFALKIPLREGWRPDKLGYEMRGGRLWITQDWWIDQSYGHELETAQADAFKELIETPGEVKALNKKVDILLSRSEPRKVDAYAPDNKDVPGYG